MKTKYVDATGGSVKTLKSGYVDSHRCTSKPLGKLSNSYGRIMEMCLLLGESSKDLSHCIEVKDRAIDSIWLFCYHCCEWIAQVKTLALLD